MADLTAVIKATRASASALAAMGKHARAAADASGELERLFREIANAGDDGFLVAVRLGARIAEQTRRKAKAIKAFAVADHRYLRAQEILAANPFPGDR